MSNGRFKDKNVVVIGGNSGIGLATAIRFAKEGAHVAIIGRNEQTLKSSQKIIGESTIAIQADIANLSEIETAVIDIREYMGNVDVLFSNAGIGAMVPFSQVTEDMWDGIMDVNLKGMYFSTQKIVPLMSKGSSIVLCSSLGAIRSWPGSSIYSASKAGVNALGRAFASELLELGIRVNVIMPGGVDTPIIDRSMDAEAAKKVKKGMAAHAPMQRLAQPDEIANAVLFLSSDEASYMTGTETIIDGGIVGCSN